MKKKIIVYLYNGLNDPLIKGNIMLYIRNAAKTGDYSFYIITYEQNQFQLNSEYKKQLLEELKALNIQWKTYSWSSGSAFRKLLDFLRAATFIAYLRLFKNYKSIISLASVAGVFAYMYSVILGLKLYLYQYEPHSEYGLDAGMWKENSLVFKVLNWLEKKSAKKAEVISSGTYHMMDRLESWKVKAKCIKIPSVADHEHFVYSSELRKVYREKFKLKDDQRLIIYPGKFGDLYYKDEIGILFRAILDQSDKYFFVILTLTDQGIAKKVMDDNNIPENHYYISSAKYEEMPGYLSAADLGVVAVPPQPSKKFCSNIKVGEYLCNGLPYLICDGVSEDDEFAAKNNVGIIIKEFDQESGVQVHDKMISLMEENKDALSKRCRLAGLKYRSFEELNPRFRMALEYLTK